MWPSFFVLGRAHGIGEDLERVRRRRWWVGFEFGKLAAEVAPVAEQGGKFRWGFFHGLWLGC